jgi:hypothetical protein
MTFITGVSKAFKSDVLKVPLRQTGICLAIGAVCFTGSEAARREYCQSGDRSVSFSSTIRRVVGRDLSREVAQYSEIRLSTVVNSPMRSASRSAVFSSSGRLDKRALRYHPHHPPRKNAAPKMRTISITWVRGGLTLVRNLLRNLVPVLVPVRTGILST